jgi:hypothetical protein
MGVSIIFTAAMIRAFRHLHITLTQRNEKEIGYRK